MSDIQQAVREKYGVQTTSCIAQVLGDPEVEAVAIAAPAAQHYPLVRQALDAGAVRNAVATGRKLLREAASHLDNVPHNKYRTALVHLVESLDAMITPFGE